MGRVWKGTVTLLLAAFALASCRAPAPAPSPGPDPGHSRLTRMGGKAEDPYPAAGRVIFSALRGSNSWSLFSISNGGPAIAEVLHADADLRAPALSPDGTQLAFACNRRGTWDVYVAPLADLGLDSWRLVAGSDDDETGPAWAPDGNRLAWASLNARESSWKLKIREADGSVRDLGEGFAPAWHPSRDLIACQRKSADGRLWTPVVVEVASGRATDLWPEPSRGGITPAWTADGRWVLVASVLDLGHGAQFDGLWAISPDGASRARLTQGGAEEWSPREGPDARIVYSRRDGETVDLWSFPSPLR